MRAQQDHDGQPEVCITRARLTESQPRRAARHSGPRKRIQTWSKLFGIAALALSVQLSTPPEAEAYANRAGRFQLGGGMGFTVDPDTFSLVAEGAYYLTQNLSVNPRIGFGFGRAFLFMAMADARYAFDINHPKLLDFKPFVGGGLGVVVGDPPGVGDTDVAFALEFPVGFDWYLTELNPNVSIGTEMQFMVPIDLFDDSFMFQWLIATAKYLF